MRIITSVWFLRRWSRMGENNASTGSSQGWIGDQRMIKAGTVLSSLCVLWVVAIAFIAVTFDYYDLELFLIVQPRAGLAVAIACVVPFAALVAGVRRVDQREFLAGLGWLSVPVLGIATGLFGCRFGDDIMFRLNKPNYVRLVWDMSAGPCPSAESARWHARVLVAHCGSPTIVVIPWGESLGLWHGVIYDATDEISKPAVQRSLAWLSTDAGRALQNSGVGRALGGHYYLAGGYFWGGCDDCTPSDVRLTWAREGLGSRDRTTRG